MKNASEEELNSPSDQICTHCRVAKISPKPCIRMTSNRIWTCCIECRVLSPVFYLFNNSLIGWWAMHTTAGRHHIDSRCERCTYGSRCRQEWPDVGRHPASSRCCHLSVSQGRLLTRHTKQKGHNHRSVVQATLAHTQCRHNIWPELSLRVLR